MASSNEWDQFWKNYPTGTERSVLNELFTPYPSHLEHSCTVRLSTALNKSGFKIALKLDANATYSVERLGKWEILAKLGRNKKGQLQDWYILRVRDMVTYLNKECGKPNNLKPVKKAELTTNRPEIGDKYQVDFTFTGSRDRPSQKYVGKQICEARLDAVTGRKGIIAFLAEWVDAPEAEGHFDVWNGKEMRHGHLAYFAHAYEVLFWNFGQLKKAVDATKKMDIGNDQSPGMNGTGGTLNLRRRPRSIVISKSSEAEDHAHTQPNPFVAPRA